MGLSKLHCGRVLSKRWLSPTAFSRQRVGAGIAQDVRGHISECNFAGRVFTDGPHGCKTLH